MKPNKSAGCDEIPIEIVKYAPDKIHEQIAKIYNNMADNWGHTKRSQLWHIKTTSKAKQNKRFPVKSETYYPNFFPTLDPCSMYHQQNQR